jgi:hypothetical protein
MGIQHKSLPFAAVQFHPESILTSPAHGMAILENAIRFLKYPEEDDLAPKSGAEIVGKLEALSEDVLRERLAAGSLAATGSKSELVVRLALYTHKRTEVKAGRLLLGDLSLDELEELQRGLGLKRSASTKEELAEALEASLLVEQ